MNLAALLRVFTRDLYEFDLYDLFLERISRTNRGIPVFSENPCEIRILQKKKIVKLKGHLGGW